MWIDIELEYLNKVEETVISRSLKMKDLKSVYDRSSSLHNLTREQLQVKFKTMKMQLKVGNIGKKYDITRAYTRFKKQVEDMYLSPQRYQMNIIDERRLVYIRHMENVGGMEDRSDTILLLNLLKEKGLIDNFFKSDRFFMTPSVESEGWRKFLNEYGETLEMAKLKDYVEHHIDLEEINKYFSARGSKYSKSAFNSYVKNEDLDGEED